MRVPAKLAGVGAIALLAGTALSTGASAQVTYDRLLNPEPENWLTHNLTYDGHRYSLLDEINTGNVGDLRVAFTLPLMPHIHAGLGSGQGTPLVDNGIMYMVDMFGVVYRIDVSSGRQARINWIMDPETDPESFALANNKGVALFGDTVYSAEADGLLIATDAASGEVLWQVDTRIDPDEEFTMAPLALDGMIINGPRGDAPMRGWLDARSTEDGSQIWHFWAVPAPGEPGGETWPADNDAYLVSGTSFWVTGTYDSESNLLFYGTSNPTPFGDPTLRAGDNLYSQATVALDADTGQLAWYFQYTPQDQWDYDENGTNQVIRTADGEFRIGHFGRNGFAYILDGATGEFINGVQYVNEVNWTAGLDPKTGMPIEYDPALREGGYQQYAINPYAVAEDGALAAAGIVRSELICPHIQGGNNHWPTSYSDRTGLMYATAIEGCSRGDPAAPITGSVIAVDADGNIANKVPIPFAPYGGQLTTAGGLLFSNMVNGDIFAMDDTTLEVLWSFNVGTAIEAPPITYAVDGKQYIAVLVGNGRLSRGHAARGEDPSGEPLLNLQPAYTMYFFTL
ncbi:MAG: PQQ-binding-like beta-propeller repeat protein [Bauldia sp.]|nr:PQQ-binding-like beta-propeller repeat protein [Bauldia sp.]